MQPSRARRRPCFQVSLCQHYAGFDAHANLRDKGPRGSSKTAVQVIRSIASGAHTRSLGEPYKRVPNLETML